MQKIEKVGIEDIDNLIDKLNESIGEVKEAENDLKQTVENANKKAKSE